MFVCDVPTSLAVQTPERLVLSFFTEGGRNELVCVKMLFAELHSLECFVSLVPLRLRIPRVWFYPLSLVEASFHSICSALLGQKCRLLLPNVGNNCRHARTPLSRGQSSCLPGVLKRVQLTWHEVYDDVNIIAQVCQYVSSASQFRVQNFCSWNPGTCSWEKIQENTLCRSGSVAVCDVGVSNPTLARDQRRS